jgi:CubicO group peptidase (beta-lactamase class C family)
MKKNYMKRNSLASLVTLAIGFGLLALAPNAAYAQEIPKTPDYWPTAGWKSSPPEEQGVDSEKLADMIDLAFQQGYNIRSVSVVRNGYLILDAYFHPFPRDTWHVVQSCTKSITSSLIGIAIDKGYIESVEVPVLDLFPEISPENLEKNKKMMTLHDLLTMASGLDTRDSWLYRWEGLTKMRSSPDWARYALDLPMSDPPGTRFEYSNCVAHLIGVILQRATQTDALTFAREHLLDPLGIGEVDWQKKLDGTCFGWAGIRMRPLDMAKIGFLYLNNGMWEGRQIISREWIEESTRSQIHAASLTESYGYEWWIDDSGCYAALGYGGQYIVVCPSKNIVVVFTGVLQERDFEVPRVLLERYIQPACSQSLRIEENPEGVARLEAAVRKVENPGPSPVPRLPAIARTISGKTYEFDPNPGPFKTISLSFSEGEDEAQVRLGSGAIPIELTVGLDDMYRVTESEVYFSACKGHWESDSTFVMSFQIVDRTQRGELRIRFEGETLAIRSSNFIAGERQDFVGRVRE